MERIGITDAPLDLPALIALVASDDSGAIATFLGTSRRINELRGQIFSWEGIKLVPTFHPAYLLRNPSEKRKTWEDMKLVRSLLDES